MPTSASSFTLSVTLGEHSFSASGKSNLVFKAFEDFKVLAGQGDAPDDAERKGATAGKTKPSKVPKPPGNMTLPAFLARLTLKGGAQIGTAIVVWSAQHSDKNKLTPAEIQALWKQTKYKLPSNRGNLSRDLNKAVKQGLLRKEGERQSQVFYADAYEQQQVEAWATSSGA
ncbi:MAG: hypothetical protein ACM3N0_07905 [Chloroflexota bacterium]